MENKSISQIALEKIKEDKIVPISKNIFSIKRVLFWVAVATSFIVGAITFSLVLSALFNNDWDLYNKLGFSFVFKTLPYFWLASLLIFTFLGEFYYRKTLFGHRKGFIVVLSVYMISTTLFGTIFYLVGTDNFIEESLENEAPIYRHMMFNRYEVWSHPENGFFSGKIVRIIDEGIEVVDPEGYIWAVNTKDAFIRGRIEVEIGEKIKIIGKCIDNICVAYEVRPWQGMNRRYVR